MADIRLADLKPIGTLGVGGFGRVELIKCLRAIPAKGQRLPDSYALKVMRKGKFGTKVDDFGIFWKTSYRYNFDITENSNRTSRWDL